MKSNNKLIRFTQYGTLVLLMVTIINTVSANEIADLKKQLELLAQKVEILELKRNKAQARQVTTETVPIKDVVTAGAVPSSWTIPGTDTSMRISGFVRAHMIYDLSPRPTSSGGDVASVHRAILENTPEYQNRGDTRLSGKDARFAIETFSPTDYGNMRTFIQGDFKGDPDNKGSRGTTSRTAFNLRHAYGEIGNFLIGQTYSTFLNNTVFGDKVDPTGPTGRTMIRQGQIRYTHRFDDEREWAFAVENPHADFVNADDENMHDGYPDLAMHYRHETDDWMYHFGAMVRRMGINEGIPGGAKDNITAWGLTTSGRYWFPDHRDRLTWYINLGDGIGRYLEGGRDQGASITPEGKLDSQFGYGGFVTYKHMWTDTISSNIDFGMGFYNLNPDEDAEANRKLFSSHMNIIWMPMEQLEFGLEYIWGYRVVHDGRTGDINRLMVNSIFNF